MGWLGCHRLTPACILKTRRLRWSAPFYSRYVQRCGLGDQIEALS
jgi:hypothetical protein